MKNAIPNIIVHKPWVLPIVLWILLRYRDINPFVEP